MFKKVIIGAAVVAGGGAGGYFAYREWVKRHPNTPFPVMCPMLKAPKSTNADTGYGELEDMAAEGPVHATLAGSAVNVGDLYVAWSANAADSSLTIDAAKTHTASDGLGTLAEADAIYISLPGIEHSDVSAMTIEVTKASFVVGSGGEQTCVQMEAVKSSPEGSVDLKLSRTDGKTFPVGTILPAINLRLLAPAPQ